MAAFEAERPRILGVLLDAVAKGLAELPRTRTRQTAAHGRFRAVGDGLRNRALATFWSAYCGSLANGSLLLSPAVWPASLPTSNISRHCRRSKSQRTDRLDLCREPAS